VDVNDNRSLAQIVDIFLQQFPDRAPPAEEIQGLDRLYRPGQRVLYNSPIPFEIRTSISIVERC